MNGVVGWTLGCFERVQARAGAGAVLGGGSWPVLVSFGACRRKHGQEWFGRVGSRLFLSACMRGQGRERCWWAGLGQFWRVQARAGGVGTVFWDLE